MRALVLPLAEAEQPCGDEAPGYEGFPEGIEDGGPGKTAGEVGFAAVAMRGGEVGGDGHADPEQCGAEDRQSGVFPGELAEPVETPGGDADGEEEDVAGEIG